MFKCLLVFESRKYLNCDRDNSKANEEVECTARNTCKSRPAQVDFLLSVSQLRISLKISLSFSTHGKLLANYTSSYVYLICSHIQATQNFKESNFRGNVLLSICFGYCIQVDIN